MENWFEETGKPALFQAFTQACNRIERDFKDSVEAEKHEKAELDAELQLLRVRASNVDRLEQQNKALKEELTQLKRSFQQPHLDGRGQENTSPSKSRASRPPGGSTRVPLTPVSVNVRKSIKNDDADVTGLSHRELATEYGILDGKHQKLRSQAADLVQANEKLQSELRERTKTVHSWKEHATKLKENLEKRKSIIKQLKEELAVATNNATPNSSFSSDTNPNSPDARVPDVAETQNALHTRDCPSIVPSAHNDGNPLLHFDKSPVGPNGENDTPDNNDDQTAEEPVLPPMPVVRSSKVSNISVKNEPSSDTPIVVSERPVRKRRLEDNSSIQGPAVTRVKTEEGSDPVVTDDQRHFVPHESIDFDDGGDSVLTPRINRTSHQTAIATATARGFTPQDHLRDTTGSPHDLASNSSPSASEHVSMSTRAQGRTGPLSDKSVMPAPDGGSAHKNYKAPVEPGLTDSHRDSISPSPKFSACRSPGTKNQLPGPVKPASRPATGENPTLLGGIASLTEDEDRDETTEKPGQTSRITGRLDTLLKTTSPDKRAMRPVRAALPGFVSSLPSTRTTPLGKEGRDNVKSTNSKRTWTAIQSELEPSSAGGRSKRPGKDSLRLRDRPQSSLRLGDFKINPKHNDGLDYAFTEVVRSKEDRLCLPGCVKEECCGPGFRNQARGERLGTGAIAFQSLLENWLGDEAWKLSSMTQDEKEALWLKAKTQQVANEYGKGHRHRFQRGSTPPGYFNVDFPSTQQLEEDNQLTAVMQRERVEERYREAMKPNQSGRWLFRDE